MQFIEKKGVDHSLHITDVFFFQELSKAMGPNAAKEWLSCVVKPQKSSSFHRGNGTKSAVCKKSAPPLLLSSSFKCLVSKHQSISPTSSSSFSEPPLRSPSAALHAWDVEDILLTIPQFDRTRSSPAICNSQMRTGGIRKEFNSCNYGLLFTDAAHTVINDLGDAIFQA